MNPWQAYQASKILIEKLKEENEDYNELQTLIKTYVLLGLGPVMILMTALLYLVAFFIF